MSNLMDKYLKERPTVQPREDGFTSSVSETYLQTESNVNLSETNTDNPTDSIPVHSLDSDDLNDQLPLTLEIDKQGKIVRLEKGVQSEILALCAAEGITLEVFLESAWVSLKSNQKLTDRVIKEAKQRRELRKELGNLRRFETGQRKTRQRLAKLNSKK